MTKNKKLELIAFTLFQYHQNIQDIEEAKEKWENLPHERDYGRYFYPVCKSEYFRMAKGVITLDFSD